MSGWGNILSTAVRGVIGGSTGGTLGNLINFGYGVLNQVGADKQARQSSNAYYDALARNNQLTQMAGEIAIQRANWEKALKERAMGQVGELGATLRQAQTNMGAMPQFDQGKIDRDYQTTKSTMMSDFNSLLKTVESQGRSDQIERLGGAGSTAADDTRMLALTKRFAPELQKIDDAAYDSAVSRATNTNNLINTNRQNTLSEISGVYNAEINPTIQLLSGNDVSNLINTQAGGLRSAESAMRQAGEAAGQNNKAIEDNLGALLEQVFNRRRTNPNRIEM